MRRGRTTLVIAHRYSMVQDADHVVVLDAGRIAEEGKPAELLATGGWFARLASGDIGDAPSSDTGAGTGGRGDCRGDGDRDESEGPDEE